MKNLLTVAFTVTILYACGGEFQHQDKTSSDQTTHTEQNTMEQGAIEKYDITNKQIAKKSNEATKQATIETKTNSAIKMATGLARSMF